MTKLILEIIIIIIMNTFETKCVACCFIDAFQQAFELNIDDI